MLKRSEKKPELQKPASGHSKALAADPFSYQSSHRRLVYLLRAAVIVIVTESFAITVLATVVINLFPLKEIRPALIRADPSSDKIYRVEPLREDVEGFDVALEKKAREYITLILPIDEVSQNYRFKTALMFSDPKFFNKFIEERKDLIEQALEDGLNRSITVETANRVFSENGVYQYSVDFIRTDRVKDAEPVVRKLRAYMMLTTRPQEVTEQEKFNNPFGIRVLGLVVKERTSL